MLTELQGVEKVQRLGGCHFFSMQGSELQFHSSDGSILNRLENVTGVVASERVLICHQDEFLLVFDSKGKRLKRIQRVGGEEVELLEGVFRIRINDHRYGDNELFVDASTGKLLPHTPAEP